MKVEFRLRVFDAYASPGTVGITTTGVYTVNAYIPHIGYKNIRLVRHIRRKRDAAEQHGNQCRLTSERPCVVNTNLTDLIYRVNRPEFMENH